MMITLYSGTLFSRESDSVNSIGLALILMLLFNPYSAVSISLWMSVLATVGILLLAPNLSGKLIKIFCKFRKLRYNIFTERICEAVAVTLSAILFTAPVTISVFGCVSTVSLPANLLMIIPGSLCMELGGIAAALAVLGFGIFSKILMYPALTLSRALIFCSNLLSDFRFASIEIHTAQAKLALSAAAVFVTAILFIKTEGCKKTGDDF